MNKPTRAVLVAVGAALLLPGCVIVDNLGRGHHGVKVRECHPSEYWDGTQCRHKGNGHGGKHDD